MKHGSVVAGDVATAFGERVRALRQDRGWSQQQAADRLAVAMGRRKHQTTFAKIEAASRPVTIEEAAALAQVFGVDVASLISASALHRNDVLRAAAVAGLVHPGPVGDAIGDLLMCATVADTAFRDVLIGRLAVAVLGAAPDQIPARGES